MEADIRQFMIDHTIMVASAPGTHAGQKGNLRLFTNLTGKLTLLFMGDDCLNKVVYEGRVLNTAIKRYLKSVA
jgi:hypothetical protein